MESFVRVDEEGGKRREGVVVRIFWFVGIVYNVRNWIVGYVSMKYFEIIGF